MLKLLFLILLSSSCLAMETIWYYTGYQEEQMAAPYKLTPQLAITGEGVGTVVQSEQYSTLKKLATHVEGTAYIDMPCAKLLCKLSHELAETQQQKTIALILIDSLREENARHKDNNLKSTVYISKLEDDVRELRSKHQRMVEEKEFRICSLKEHIELLKQKIINQLNEQELLKETFEKQYKQLLKKHNELTNNNDTCHKSLEQKNRKITSLQTEISMQKQEIDTIKQLNTTRETLLNRSVAELTSQRKTSLFCNKTLLGFLGGIFVTLCLSIPHFIDKCALKFVLWK